MACGPTDQSHGLQQNIAGRGGFRTPRRAVALHAVKHRSALPDVLAVSRCTDVVWPVVLARPLLQRLAPTKSGNEGTTEPVLAQHNRLRLAAAAPTPTGHYREAPQQYASLH